MTPFLQFIFTLSAIIVAAKSAGYLSTRVGQPSVLGELIVGLILGPSLLDLTHSWFITDPHLHEIIYELGELGVLLLMFIAGLELHVSDLTRNTRVAAYSGILGVAAPVGLGYATGLLLGQPSNVAFFLGLSLGATSVSISAQTLIELGVLRSRVGFTLLGAAVFDDILVILLLSLFLAIVSGGSGILSILLIIGKMILFLSLSVGFGLWGLPRFTRFIKKLSISQGPLSFAIVIILIYGLAAELIGGMAAITGTFIAGLMFSRVPEKAVIETGLRAIAYGFFVPIFFVSIGLGVNISSLGVEVLWGALLISIVAIVGKVLGSGLGARLGRLSWPESLQVSVGMVSRGEVGLIVAQLGASVGLLDDNTFSAIVAMVILTTLVTPPLLRSSFKLTRLPNSSNSLEAN
ncbi:MAG: cation:proton antiporter [Anaerolineaceae bacterium]|nr:cation:proton antiporter [Anaerolineaceae bacterium]